MRDKVLDWLRVNVNEHRLTHILGVEQMSRSLAQYHGLDPDQAAQAGLMHDLAKFFPPDKLLAMADQEGLELDEILRHTPHLIHADISAIVARDEFGVQDEVILEAIRNHTLGKPGMDKLSCVVFLADALEPNRGESEELQKLRQVSHHHLLKAVYKTCDYTLHHLINHQKTIHPRAVLTRNWALRESHNH